MPTSPHERGRCHGWGLSLALSFSRRGGPGRRDSAGQLRHLLHRWFVVSAVTGGSELCRHDGAVGPSNPDREISQAV